MGLFDTVHCEYPLPDARHQGLEFQTKDLDCALDTYTITIDGRLLRRSWRFGQEALQLEVEWPIHGDVRFYTHEKSLDPPWIEYVARFTRGRVEWILPLDEARRTPGVVLDGEPLPPPSESAEPEAEPGSAAPSAPLQAESAGAAAFLEMAVRYADLPAPPNPLPSGYAALLYLYGLR